MCHFVEQRFVIRSPIELTFVRHSDVVVLWIVMGAVAAVHDLCAAGFDPFISITNRDFGAGVVVRESDSQMIQMSAFNLIDVEDRALPHHEKRLFVFCVF